MKSFATLFILLFLSLSVIAAGEWTSAGGRQAAMGLSGVALVDSWSVNNNQAAMAFFDQSAAGVYFENRYLIKEMGYQSGAATLKTRYGMLGANVGYSGDANFNTMKAGLAYARKIGSRFSVGVQLDYISTALGEEYGKKSNVTFEAGVMVRMTEELTFGAHLFNPVHVKIAEYGNERIPTILNAGFAYTFSKKLILTAEAYKNSEYPLEIRTGAEYKIGQIAYVRAGVSSNPFRYTFGFGLEMKSFTLDLSSSVHETLGYSPQVSLQYNFGN